MEKKICVIVIEIDFAKGFRKGIHTIITRYSNTKNTVIFCKKERINLICNKIDVCLTDIRIVIARYFNKKIVL